MFLVCSLSFSLFLSFSLSFFSSFLSLSRLFSLLSHPLVVLRRRMLQVVDDSEVEGAFSFFFFLFLFLFFLFSFSTCFSTFCGVRRRMLMEEFFPFPFDYLFFFFYSSLSSLSLSLSSLFSFPSLFSLLPPSLSSLPIPKPKKNKKNRMTQI